MDAAPSRSKVMQVEVELQRKDGTTFPAEETIHRVRVGDEVMLSAFIRDLTERRRRQQEREALLGEQAARAEAERVAEMVSGMQLLVDAALAHRTTADILPGPRGPREDVLGADAAIDLPGRGRPAGAAGVLGRRRTEAIPSAVGVRRGLRRARGGRPRQPMLSHDPTADVEDPALRDLELGLAGGRAAARRGRASPACWWCAPPRRDASPPRTWALLRLAADRVALGIDRARVYEREHRIAETLQRSLLPDRLPQLPGLAVAARYLPAAAEAEVGGDWYDVIPIPGGRVGMVMGDVAGKGLAAASMVGRLRSALRAYALEGHDPATALEQLNRLLWTEAEDSQMATLLYAIVDPARGHDPLGQRRAHAAAARGRGRRARPLPRRRALGAARRAARSRPSRRRRLGAARRHARWCSTRTAWSSARARSSTRASRCWPARSTASGPTRRRSATTCSPRSCPDGGAPRRRGAARAPQRAR